MARRKAHTPDEGETRTQRRNDLLPLSLAPRGLSRVEASAYIGVSPSLFDEMVRDGRMPGPKRINARTVWDRRKVDEAFECLPEDSRVEQNPWDEEGLTQQA